MVTVSALYSASLKREEEKKKKPSKLDEFMEKILYGFL